MDKISINKQFSNNGTSIIISIWDEEGNTIYCGKMTLEEYARVITNESYVNIERLS